MFIDYNTPEFRKLYKSYKARYDRTDHNTAIEGRVRALCSIIRWSGLGVSIFSCEGHPSQPECDYYGYVMLAARNRDDSTKLISMFQRSLGQMIERFEWNYRGEIEANIYITYDTDGKPHHYPAIIVRCDAPEEDATEFWSSLTSLMFAELKPWIGANPEYRKLTKEALS